MPHAAAVPENPTDLPARSLPSVLKRTVSQFSDDKLPTWAAALTYYAVLSIFPALLALVSILGVIGPSATQPLIDNLERRARAGEGHPHQRAEDLESARAARRSR